MSGSTLGFYVIAIAFVVLAIVMSLFSSATHMELAGFWLAAATAFGVANLQSAEDSRPLQPIAF